MNLKHNLQLKLQNIIFRIKIDKCEQIKLYTYMYLINNTLTTGGICKRTSAFLFALRISASSSSLVRNLYFGVRSTARPLLVLLRNTLLKSGRVSRFNKTCTFDEKNFGAGSSLPSKIDLTIKLQPILDYFITKLR